MLTHIPGEKTPPGLIKEPVFYTDIPKKSISKVLDLLKKVVRSRGCDMQHIKRVQPHPSDPQKMSVLLCFQWQMSKQELAILISPFVESEILETFAAKYPARTKEEASAWSSEVWPIMWRGNISAQPPTISSKDENFITNIISEHFNLEETSECCTKCMILDTEKSEICGQGVSHEQEHPLKHSVMAAIESVADQARNSAKDIYLCVGMDVICSMEPCIMCCMALVHSRIGRLIIIKDSPSTHSSITHYKLHGRTQLNHTFEAWKYNSS